MIDNNSNVSNLTLVLFKTSGVEFKWNSDFATAFDLSLTVYVSTLTRIWCHFLGKFTSLHKIQRAGKTGCTENTFFH